MLRPRRIGRIAAIAAFVVVASLLAPRGLTWLLARGDVAHAAKDVPRLAPDEDRAALVLGAGLVDGRPSPLLRERIDAAVGLLEGERVDLLVVSGDNSTDDYDEPNAMRDYAIEEGAPPELVAADYAGRRTWDSCVRARRVFGIRHVVVVTNAFHVDRAVASCRAAGIDTLGFSVDESAHGLAARTKWRLRELLATDRALVDAWLLRPDPAVGGDRIDPYDPCELRESLAPSVADRSAEAFAEFDCG